MAGFWPYKIPADEFMSMKVDEKKDLTRDKDWGIIKHLLKEGEGEDYPCPGDTVTLHYNAYVQSVAEENIFDTSRHPDKQNGETKPYVFTMGKGEVIQGFETVIATMRKGEKAVIHLEPIYGFGKKGALPKIPANTKVIFDTEILDFHGEDLSDNGDKSIVKKIISSGQGHVTPNDGATVEVHIIGEHKGRQFEDRDVTFILGEGSLHSIPADLEEVIGDLRQDEKAKFTFGPQYNYKDQGCPEKGIPPDAELVYTVHMRKFERVKDVWEMNNEQKMDQCGYFKQKGTDFFKKEKFEVALKYYSQILSFLENDRCMSGEEETRRASILLSGYLNCALCSLKLENYPEVRKMCDRAIVLDTGCVKAHFRRGQANIQTKDYDQAKQDFETVIRLEPSNKAARNKLKECENLIPRSSGQQKELYKKMMSGMGKRANGQADFVPYTPNSNEDVFDTLGDWNNDMARGMMTLEQECEAFGETIPVRGNNNHGHHPQNS